MAMQKTPEVFPPYGLPRTRATKRCMCMYMMEQWEGVRSRID